MTFEYSDNKLVQETTANGYVHDDEEDNIGGGSNDGVGGDGHGDGCGYCGSIGQ